MTMNAKLEKVDLSVLERTARIVGGGAQKCLEHYCKLIDAGKPASVWLDRKNQSWVVSDDSALSN